VDEEAESGITPPRQAVAGFAISRDCRFLGDRDEIRQRTKHGKQD
jgi:hypothetical protein